jgi:competence protein ComEA
MPSHTPMKILARSLPGWMFWELVTSCALPGLAQRPMPPAEGREIVMAACTLCHSPTYVTRFDRTPAEWREMVSFMVGLGAPLTADEIESTIQYLSKNFGSTKPLSGKGAGPAQVNVNQATLGELEAAFGLSAREAEAIVRYREQNGSINKWEDLKKVPGVNLKKLEAKNDRMSF